MDVTAFGMVIPLKYLSLLILVIQNSALILVMRFTRAGVPDDQLYLASTAVVMSEIIKGLACVGLLHFSGPLHQRTLSRLASLLQRELISNWRETAKLGVPAALYLIQNNLQYVAATNLDAATFQVTYQLKILTTAFFSVLILKRTLSRLKWIALGLLTFGIALVVLPKDASAAVWAYFIGGGAGGENTFVLDQDASTMGVSDVGNQSNTKGFFAVLMACTLSGLAGVYFEKILKGPTAKPIAGMVNTRDEELVEESRGNNNSNNITMTNMVGGAIDRDDIGRGLPKRTDVNVDDDDTSDGHSANQDDDDMGLRGMTGGRRMEAFQTQQQNELWIRNLQMSFFSILLGLVFVVMLQDGATIVQNGFFVNYNGLTWLVISIQAFGGLVVALVVKTADNILKGFATSISIILSSVVSIFLFNFALSGTFIIGTTLVIYATYLYGL